MVGQLNGAPDEHGQGIHQRERHDEPKHWADGVIKFVVLVGCLLAVEDCKSGDGLQLHGRARVHPHCRRLSVDMELLPSACQLRELPCSILRLADGNGALQMVHDWAPAPAEALPGLPGCGSTRAVSWDAACFRT